MSDSKQLWYHVATDEWKEVPPIGTWAVAHLVNVPNLRAVIDQLQRENAALRTELKDAAMKGLKVALKAQAADLSDLQRENAALRAALKPLLRHRPDGDVGWRGNTKAKCGWILVSDILRIEAAFESKEAKP